MNVQDVAIYLTILIARWCERRTQVRIYSDLCRLLDYAFALLSVVFFSIQLHRKSLLIFVGQVLLLSEHHYIGQAQKAELFRLLVLHCLC